MLNNVQTEELKNYLAQRIIEEPSCNEALKFGDGHKNHLGGNHYNRSHIDNGGYNDRHCDQSK